MVGCLSVLIGACASKHAREIPEQSPARAQERSLDSQSKSWTPIKSEQVVTRQPPSTGAEVVKQIPQTVVAPPRVDPHGNENLSARTLFERVKDVVVVIKAYDSIGKIISQGSGVILPTGNIVTNCHVVAKATNLEVEQRQHRTFAKLVAGDVQKDLCILKASLPFGKSAVIGGASNLSVGDRLYALGSPLGLELTLSEGIVSQLRGGTPPLIQMTASISPGSSGGGVFDSKGRLVGISALYMAGGQNLNFALPIEWIED